MTQAWARITLIACTFVVCVGALSQLDASRLAGSQMRSSQVLPHPEHSGFPRIIIDPIGRELSLPQAPQTIVSGILAGDEMLSVLVDQERIKSVTFLADDVGISNVANQFPPSITRNYGQAEEFVALEPDLLIMAAYNEASTIELLLNTGVPILRFTQFDTYADVRQNLRTLAKALGKDAEIRAEQWILDTNERLNSVAEKLEHQAMPRVLYYSLSGATSGEGSLIDETIRLAGGYNVINETGLGAYATISQELAIALQPEVILINDWGTASGNSAVDVLTRNPAWQQVPAIENQRVYGVSGAWLTSSTLYRVEGVEVVARLLHPDVFSDAIAERESKAPAS